MSSLDDAVADLSSSSTPSDGGSSLDQAINEIHTDSGVIPPKKKTDLELAKERGLSESSGMQLVHQMASGAGHAIVGGYKGLGTLLTTGDPDKAADTVNAETSKAYVAPDSGLKTVAASKWNPLNWIQNTADYAADKSADAGAAPIVSTAIKSAPTAMVAGLGLTGLVRGGMSYGGIGLRAPVTTTADGAASWAPPLPTAQSVVDKSSAGQSMGAAGAATDVSAASQPLKDSIAAIDPDKVHQQALLNHLEAEKHGLVGDAGLTKGQATRDPIQFSEEQNRSDDPKVAARLSNQNTAMVDDLDRIRREASPTQVQNDAVEHGQNVVDALKAYDEPVKADISAKYKALADANGGEFPIGGRTLNENIDAALAKNNREGMVPADIQRTLDKYRDGSRQMTFNDFESLRSDAADAMRSAANGRERNAASIVREQLENLPLLPKAAGLKDMADTARSAAKARFDALDSDPAYQAAVDDVTKGVKKGEPSALADKFLDKYALQAPKANLDRMMSKLDDTGKEAVASHTLNTVRGAAVGKTGTITPAAFNGVLEKYGPKLESLVKPETADDLRESARVVSNAKSTPPGSTIAPKSGVIVRSALEAGTDVAANALTKGVYGTVKKFIPKSNKFVNDALKPGAGIEKP